MDQLISNYNNRKTITFNQEKSQYINRDKYRVNNNKEIGIKRDNKSIKKMITNKCTNKVNLKLPGKE